MATDVETAPISSRPITRRNFIVWYLTGLLTAFAVAIVAPILVFIWPPAGNNKNAQIATPLDKGITALQDGEAVQFNAPPNTAYVMADGGGDNAKGDLAFGGYLVKSGSQVNVFAINCSHLGCSYALNQPAHTFDCPCHGSRFNLNGTVLHGPAVAPLSHLTWKQGSSDKEILIDGIQFGQGAS